MKNSSVTGYKYNRIHDGDEGGTSQWVVCSSAISTAGSIELFLLLALDRLCFLSSMVGLPSAESSSKINYNCFCKTIISIDRTQ